MARESGYAGHLAHYQLPEEVMTFIDLDVIVRFAEQRGCSLYEAEAELISLLTREDEEESQ